MTQSSSSAKTLSTATPAQRDPVQADVNTWVPDQCGHQPERPHNHERNEVDHARMSQH